jgi:hypothetical protein
MEAREHAENLARYFENIARENDGEVWRKGLSTAQEWLRLINAENASQAELSTFINVVHANRYRTSGWFDLALGAYHWVSTKDITISSPDVFFASEGVPVEQQFTATPLEYTHIVAEFFEQYHHEDPSNEAWAIGLENVREWLRLSESGEIRRSEVEALVRSVFKNYRRFHSKVWFDMAIGVGGWCKANGNLDLIPDDFRHLLSRDNEDPQLQ